MSVNKAQKLKLQALQKEQVQLVKIENILSNLLGKINESLNELKVEELQIKSNIIEQYTTNTHDDQPTTSARAADRLNTTPLMLAADSLNIQNSSNTLDMEGIEDINKQMLTLESLLVPLKQKNFKEEQDEEDDEYEDDEYMPSANEETEEDDIEKILS